MPDPGGGGPRARPGAGLLSPALRRGSRSAPLVEETGDQGRRLVGPHARYHLDFVVEPGVDTQVVERAAGAGLGIGGAEHHPVHPARHQRTRAHRARLDRDHERRTLEPPPAHDRRRVAQRQQLGMSGGGAPAFAPGLPLRGHRPAAGPAKDRRATVRRWSATTKAAVVSTTATEMLFARLNASAKAAAARYVRASPTGVRCATVWAPPIESSAAARYSTGGPRPARSSLDRCAAFDDASEDGDAERGTGFPGGVVDG